MKMVVKFSLEHVPSLFNHPDVFPGSLVWMIKSDCYPVFYVVPQGYSNCECRTGTKALCINDKISHSCESVDI